MHKVSRREAITLVTTITGGALLGACKLTTKPVEYELPDGRIIARPTASVTATAAAGTFDCPETTNLSHGLFFVPKSYTPDKAIPLVVVFHGASGQAASLLTPLSELAEELGMALLAIKSRENTWDVIANGLYGIDVNFLNRAMAGLFTRVRIDPAKIGIAGFSDGATYSLSLGRVNGDLFSRIVAFSPGGIAAGGMPTGKPAVYITHGTRDGVLPITLTTQVILPRLQSEGYPVEFHEFDGTHQIPSNLMREAMVWLNTR